MQLHRTCLVATVLAAALGGPAAAQQPCPLTAIGTATAAAVRDGRTLLLADGRDLRLAGIEASETARAALQDITAGHQLRLERLGSGHDRYGRVVAFVFAGDAQVSVQQTLIERGLARVSARVGGYSCAAALLTTENAARAARRGIWADPNFAPLSAQDLPRLQAERGHFALVEGSVLSVRESGATIYLNFGRRWSQALTATIPRKLRRTFTAAGLEPKSLEGHRIRVRGWLEERNGPRIEADVPEQIERID